MKLALFYDTETQCLPLWGQPSEDPRQPHIVQLAARLMDLESQRTEALMNFIIKPEGWEIPDETAKIHGITTERASRVGVAERAAVHSFLDLWSLADVRIGHNESFDARILRIAMMRFCEVAEGERWKDGKAECTATLSTPLVKCPPTPKMLAAGRTHYKTPNLGEAFQFFTGKSLEGAHDAMVDVDACADVYFSILNRKKESVPA